MFIRISRIGGREYIQVVESVRVEGKTRTQYLGFLGQFDELVWKRAGKWVRDLVPLEQAGAVVSDLEESSGSLQKSHYTKRARMHFGQGQRKIFSGLEVRGDG